VRPDGQLVVVPPGHGGSRADRGVSQVGPAVGRPVRGHDACRGRGVHPALDLGALGRLPHQPVVPVGLGRQRRGLLPGGSGPQQLGGTDRLLLTISDDAQEASPPDHRHHRRQRPRGRVVDGEQARPRGGGTHHPAVDLVGQGDVVHERRVPGELPLQIRPPHAPADDGVPVRVLRRHGPGDGDVQQVGTEQGPVGPVAGAGGVPRLAVLHLQVLGSEAGVRGGRRDQQRADLGADGAHRGAGVHH
jgi:hypothetical protein